MGRHGETLLTLNTNKEAMAKPRFIIERTNGHPQTIGGSKRTRWSVWDMVAMVVVVLAIIFGKIL